MRRIVRAAWLLTPAFLAIGAGGPDEPPRPDSKAAEAVDRVLNAWHEKAATTTSVEVRFREIIRDKGTETRWSGRAILAAPNLAMVERSSVDAQGRPVEIKERTIWNGRSILRFDMETQVVERYPLRPEWPSAPGPIRLPFFYRMTVEEAKRDYDWALVREEEGPFVLKATPRRKPGRLAEADSNLIVLDRETFRPVKVACPDPTHDSLVTYQAVDIKYNTIDDPGDLENPCLDAWTVTERDGWLPRLLLR